MAKQKKGNLLGSWAFLIGVVLAVLLGLTGSISGTMLWILVIIGLIVGLLNVTEEETSPFLMSGIVLIIASAFGQDVLSAVPSGTLVLNNVLQALLVIFVPATIVVAIKNVFRIARH